MNKEYSERLDTFLNIARTLPDAKEILDNVYNTIVKYDLPRRSDRNFIFDCLIQYYSDLEEYEKCAVLVKYKNSATKVKRITVNKLTKEDIRTLKYLGIQLPAAVKKKLLSKKRN